MKAQRFHFELEKVGIPIDGVSIKGDQVTVHFRPEATPAQRTQAQTIVDSIKPYQSKTPAQIKTEILALPDQERQELLNKVLLDWVAQALSDEPVLAHRLNLPITVEELVT